MRSGQSKGVLHIVRPHAMRKCLLPRLWFLGLSVTTLLLPGFAPGANAPIRALLITGGCCHDYAKQKDILKNGLMERANIVVEQIHTDDNSTHPPLALLGNPDY